MEYGVFENVSLNSAFQWYKTSKAHGKNLVLPEFLLFLLFARYNHVLDHTMRCSSLPQPLIYKSMSFRPRSFTKSQIKVLRRFQRTLGILDHLTTGLVQFLYFATFLPCNAFNFFAESFECLLQFVSQFSFSLFSREVVSVVHVLVLAQVSRDLAHFSVELQKYFFY